MRRRVRWGGSKRTDWQDLKTSQLSPISRVIGSTRSRSVAHANVVRLQLHALAYNLGNFLRPLAIPAAIEQWSLTSLRENLIKIGAKVVSHGRYVTFQMAEAAIPRKLFAAIMRRIATLRAPPMATAT